MKKSFIFFCIYFFILSFYCFSQSAEKITEILSCDNLLKGQACYLIGCLSGELEENENFEQSFKKFNDLKMFKNDKFDENIRVDEFSALILLGTNSKGNLWFYLTKHPHYALKYLKKKNVIDKNILAKSNISSSVAMNILSSFVAEGENK